MQAAKQKQSVILSIPILLLKLFDSILSGNVGASHIFEKNHEFIPRKNALWISHKEMSFSDSL